MRSLLLIAVSFALIAAGFLAYVFVQGSTPRGGTDFQPVAAPPPPNTENVASQTLHPGNGVFMKSYDSRTHRLAYQFRADTYDPQPDGTVNMTNPEAQFFTDAGQVLQMNGETGFVVDPNGASGKVQGQSQTPSRGKIQHVILRVFKTVTDPQPQFTCYVNNLAFDNDTTTIATEDCNLPDATGTPQPTPADQVPVHVIGVDYDFDGRGLLIKWNERDRHLERLEIEHGEQLVIKHPSALSAPSGEPRSGERSLSPLSDLGGSRIELASASPDDALAAARSAGQPPATQPRKRKKRRPATRPVPPPATAPVIRRSKDPGVYRAIFFDNVHVTQAELTLATADRMNVDFYMNSSGHAATEPTTAAAEPEESLAGPSAAPSAEGTGSSAESPTTPYPAATPTPATFPTTAPTTAPMPQPPVIVRWTGKLLVTPPDPDVPPLRVGDSVVQFIGDSAPAVLTHQATPAGPGLPTGDSSIVHCASFRYHTLDQSVEINNSAAFPAVDLRDSHGTHLLAPEVDYNGQERTATILGPASADFPVTTAAHSTTQPAPMANATWGDKCTLIFTPADRGQQLQVSEALLDGAVNIRHPQLTLLAEEVDLGLDPAAHKSASSTSQVAAEATTLPSAATPPDLTSTSASQLRSMDASGNVDCTLRDSQGRMQRITGDHLTLATERDSAGTDLPSEVTADGTVNASDATQSLRAQHLIADLEPAAPMSSPAISSTTRPSGPDVQLRELTANGDVHFHAVDGKFADADSLHVQTLHPASTTAPADQEAELMGTDLATARVGDHENVLSGPIIRYNTASKTASVLGPGALHGVQATGATTTPSADANIAEVGRAAPPARPVDVSWKNSFQMDGLGNRIDIHGGVHTSSRSSDGTVNTADGDSAKILLVDAPPASQPASQPATRPFGLLATGGNDFIKGKVMDTITLLGRDGGDVEISSIARDPGGALQHSLNLYATTAIYDNTHQIFRVPVAGRMLVRDYRKTSTTDPVTKPASGDSSSGGMRGDTAFEWEKELTYDQRQDRAILRGNVQVVHEAPGAASYQMWADQIVVDFDSAPHPATQPATQAAIGPTTQASGEEAMKVKRLVATGQVRMLSQKLGFSAATAIYDPITQLMTALGSEREPAQMLDEQGLSTGTFDRLIYNTATDAVKLTEFHGDVIH